MTLLKGLADPLILLYILLAAGFILNAFKKRRIAVLLIWIAIGWLFIISTSPIPQWLTHGLESQYPVFQYDPAKPITGDSVHILVLGGGHAHAPALPHHDQLTTSALSRLAEAIRIHRQIPGSKIVFSGYSSSGRTSVAEMTARAALELGIDPTDTMMITTPRNTKEEAGAYRSRAGNAQPVILVTSAVHMPRAMKYFRAHNLGPIPAPTFHYIKQDEQSLTFNFQPSAEKIQMMQKVIHEYLGLLVFEWQYR